MRPPMSPDKYFNDGPHTCIECIGQIEYLDWHACAWCGFEVHDGICREDHEKACRYREGWMGKPFTAARYLPHPYYVGDDAPMVSHGKWRRLRKAINRRDGNAYLRIMREYRLTIRHVERMIQGG